MIVDAKGMVAGRLSTKIAKALIKGEAVTIVNAEQAIIVGTTENIMEKFRMRVNAAVKSNPHFGPKYDRIPSKMLRRMVKGMLPSKKRTALRMVKNLKVFNGVPKELSKEKFVVFEEYRCNEKHDFMTIKEIAQGLGGTW